MMAELSEKVFRVTGMDCADCARTVENGVAKLDGIEACSISFTTAKLRIRGTVDEAAIIDRVRTLGYDVASPEDDPAANEAGTVATQAGFLRFLLGQRETRLALLGAILILPGLVFNELLPTLGLHHRLFDVMSVLAMISAGYPIARSAWSALRINHDININVLMTIASVGAVIIGAYTEAGLVMVLFAIGEALEGYTADHARTAIRGLMSLAPTKATVVRPCIDCQAHMGQDGYDGGPCPICGLEEQVVDVSSLEVGETIIIRPGERIAMDGNVLQGASHINEAPITGESLPVVRAAGDTVFAGTVNGEGVLHVQVSHRSQDNTISRLIRLVEEAQESRAPAQKFIDRFARIYTPAVVLMALLVAIIPPLFLGQPFLSSAGTQGWLYRALALLVVACPCALVISTPVTLVSALSNAAANGVLVKGGVFLEAIGQVRAVAFDKTGTLTRGEPAVLAVQAHDCTVEDGAHCAACDDMVALAGALERHSEHPLAQALVAEAEDRGLAGRYGQPQAVQALAGLGIRGMVDGREVVVGSHHYFDRHVPHTADACRAVSEVSKVGQTPVMVSVDGRYLGYVTITDRLRSGTAAVVQALRDLGIGNIVLLTGDGQETGEKIGAQAGIQDVRANLLPEQKVAAVSQMLEQYGKVAMVGDGINDAPALARATVGIAMGAAGTAQAMETADIALMADDLSRLPFVIRLGRAAMRAIRWNIGLSLLIKAIFLVIVILGMGTLWMAVLADMGASLLVTLNGMRLLRRPLPI